MLIKDDYMIFFIFFLNHKGTANTIVSLQMVCDVILCLGHNTELIAVIPPHG